MAQATLRDTGIGPISGDRDYIFSGLYRLVLFSSKLGSTGI